ncbi:hypothetical protein NDU88_002954 [Pleurodeles waltl]|uniref:Uncharacterized protein n=1 Tax=Pleurodeles waltl TaxID=8319 RepID=A0AAV7TM46_PLEWA|nr:hypothetical protein NDU88_002954 [Pleurodeles waltl]
MGSLAGPPARQRSGILLAGRLPKGWRSGRRLAGATVVAGGRAGSLLFGLGAGPRWIGSHRWSDRTEALAGIQWGCRVAEPFLIVGSFGVLLRAVRCCREQLNSRYLDRWALALQRGAPSPALVFALTVGSREGWVSLGRCGWCAGSALRRRITALFELHFVALLGLRGGPLAPGPSGLLPPAPVASGARSSVPGGYQV